MAIVDEALARSEAAMDWTTFWLAINGVYYSSLVIFYLGWVVARYFVASDKITFDCDIDEAPFGPEATEFYTALKKTAANVVGAVGIMGLVNVIYATIHKMQGADNVRFADMIFLAPIPITMLFVVLKVKTILHDMDYPEEHPLRALFGEHRPWHTKPGWLQYLDERRDILDGM
ncbi:hypothetical protein BGZ63DRAFT_449068 [Mariannaea sp. PMI_226]|nr:hypothetical protein BGZ63DRAFT_449068 [Mariannaea sp. PMI_226]